MKTGIALRRSVRVKFKTDTILEIVIGNSQTGEMDLFWLDVSGIYPVLELKTKSEIPQVGVSKEDVKEDTSDSIEEEVTDEPAEED